MRIMALLVALCAAVACGGDGDGDLPLPGVSTPQDAATATPADSGNATATPSPDDDEAGSGEGTSADDIVLHEVNWFELEDELGRPAVRYAAIVENTGSDPVLVSIEIEAFDVSGESLGDSMFDWSETVGAGRRLPMSLGMGPLAASPASIEPDIDIRQIPEFRRERYGKVILDGEIVEVSAEQRSTDVFLTILVEATNVGTAGAPFGVLPHLAIYDAGGLIEGSFVAPGFIDLCPGQTAQLEVTYRVFLRGFDPDTATYAVYFSDVELMDGSETDCG